MTDAPAQRSNAQNAELSVIIVAAGQSTRMEGLDKLALDIGGRSVLWHSLEVVDRSPLVSGAVVVTHQTKVADISESITNGDFSTPIRVVSGGVRRQDSVRNGIEELDRAQIASEFIAVHDAARPFVNEDMLKRGLAAARHVGAAIPVVRLKDTIKRVEHGIVVDTPDREVMFSVQTPQVFRAEILRAAHQTVEAYVTDDASMVEVAGGLVATFEGAYENIKITTPSDVAIARAIAAGNGSEWTYRSGSGFDGHKLVEGGPLKLGGCEIEFDMRLQGHSDGDVLLHAVASAVLGAAGLGDLGGRFPSTDPKYAGADSSTFIRDATLEARALGWCIDHLDATIIAQRPRLAAYVPDFEANIADAIDTETDRVNVKVTSTDEVGAIGQGEGIAAQAIVTLRRRNVSD
ncbi:MAG: 2-C-methyl-D-erythritol 4-phosphate cytidylyltransferase [Chloroflexi bacterium]|nr:2-C-methyl-D-erythritol 4-phosphate cytidylyltransferase [Chloroflexota bacterium]